MSDENITDAAETAYHDFDPVPVRARLDGWTPQRQTAFIEALAETGCVLDAAMSVGMTPRSAYALRRRADAQSFRLAWDAALDYAVQCLSDAVLSRAINGVPVPHFYKGQQIGEHRRYNDRLAMFVLRYRDPLRSAKTNDEFIYKGHHEGFAMKFVRAVDRLEADAFEAKFDHEERLGIVRDYDAVDPEDETPPASARTEADSTPDVAGKL